MATPCSAIVVKNVREGLLQSYHIKSVAPISFQALAHPRPRVEFHVTLGRQQLPSNRWINIL